MLRLAATLALLVFGFGSQTFAGGQAENRSHERRGVTKARSGRPNSRVRHYKVDGDLVRRRNANETQRSSVIVTLAPGANLPQQFRRFARTRGNLDIINGQVLDLPNYVIRQLESRPEIFRVHHNRPIVMENYRTAYTVGSRAVQKGLGVTGAGVGVAVIDSGIATWHDDLTNRSPASYPYGNQRVASFVDFVNGHVSPYDDQGHGSHVAGIIAGNGYSSNGHQAGMAPDASLISLKVLDADGQGTISDVIAALDWVLANHAQYNIRVVNLSVGAAIRESYWTDPLTLAAKRVVDAGVTVVAAAGNRGTSANGGPQYGGVTAPGNAPWVLTVGASTTNRTTNRDDDAIASFSSRGPTYFDWAAKPDLVAPGQATVSLADPLAAFYTSKAQSLLPGSQPTPYLPYLALSGTSMAAPVVTGTIALMLQVNPSLTPNAVKAILQYTSQVYAGYNPLTQGAGFVNAIGAVRLARFFAAARPGQAYPAQNMWSKHIVWGNHMISGGVIVPTANAFAIGTNWGVAATDGGDNIVCGTMCCNACDNIVWGTGGFDDNIVWGTSGFDDNIVWGTGFDDNIVWGTDCGGADCDNIVWGTTGDDNIVWGTAEYADNIVWGTSGDDNIVWGTNGDDNIVWDTSGDDNIVWGTGLDDNIVWGTSGDDNIVWGTNGLDDNIVWGTDEYDNIVWGTTANGQPAWHSATGNVTQLSWTDAITLLSDEQVFDALTLLSSPRPALVNAVPESPLNHDATPTPSIVAPAVPDLTPVPGALSLFVSPSDAAPTPAAGLTPAAATELFAALDLGPGRPDSASVSAAWLAALAGVIATPIDLSLFPAGGV